MAQLVIRDRDDIRRTPEDTRLRLQTGHVVEVRPDDPPLVLPPPYAVVSVPGLSVEAATKYVAAGVGVRAFRLDVSTIRAALKRARRVALSVWELRARMLDELGNADLPLASDVPWWYRWLWKWLGRCRVAVVLVAVVALTGCATATIRVPVGQVTSWVYHPPAPCEPTWQTSKPAVLHVSAVDDEFRIVVLGRKPGRATVRVMCGSVTYAETVEVFRAR